MILTDAQRMAAMFGDDVSKAGLGRASIRKNLWPGAVLVYQLDPAIGKHHSFPVIFNSKYSLLVPIQRQELGCEIMKSLYISATETIRYLKTVIY